MKMKKKFKPTIEILVKSQHWDSIRSYIKSGKIRHSPFNHTWKGYVVQLEATENQELMLMMNGNVAQIKKIVAQ